MGRSRGLTNLRQAVKHKIMIAKYAAQKWARVERTVRWSANSENVLELTARSSEFSPCAERLSTSSSNVHSLATARGTLAAAWGGGSVLIIPDVTLHIQLQLHTQLHVTSCNEHVDPSSTREPEGGSKPGLHDVRG